MSGSTNINKNHNIDKKTNERDSIVYIKTMGNDEINNVFLPLTVANNDDIFEFLKGVIHHIHKILKKDKFENEYIENRFGKLSTRELISEGKTFYMNPCLDFVLVTVEGLKRSGLKNILFIIEELACPGGSHKLHFGIEIKKEDKNYYVDYRGQNNVFLGEGKFASKYEHKGEKSMHKIKIDAQNISIDDNIHTLMNRGIVQFKNFNPASFETMKEKLKRHNTPKQRTDGFVNQVNHIHQPEIFIEEKNKNIY
ncbi:MAG: hypothetical protein NTY80_04705 [candidate division SR1 bacterium]|nr:hypothetical protein [candidate division SR1 bacterium]